MCLQSWRDLRRSAADSAGCEVVNIGVASAYRRMGLADALVQVLGCALAESRLLPGGGVTFQPTDVHLCKIYFV